MQLIRYWPIFRFSQNLADFEMLAIFTSKAEAEAYASSVNAESVGESGRAVVADFDWERVREHIVHTWLAGYLKSGMKLVLEPADKREDVVRLYARSEFPVAVAKKA